MSKKSEIGKKSEVEDSPQGVLPTGDEASFGDSMEELTEIVRRIEDEQIDIDELAAALHRASELLELCRGKIRQVDLEVSQIVQRLEGSPTEGADSAGANSAGEGSAGATDADD